MDEIERSVQQANHFKLALIGQTVNDLIVAIGKLYHDAPLTKTMIEDLREYSRRIEDVGWATDPTGYRDLSQGGAFDELKRRYKLMDALIEYYSYPVEGDDE